VNDKRLRRDLEQRLRALDVTIPSPFSAEAFCGNVAEARGRAIHLIPWDTTAAVVPCGLWISTVNADYIVYEQAAAGILRQHIVLHELAHLLLGHQGAAQLAGAAGQFEFLEPDMVDRVLGRTSAYDAREEREAEVLASMVGEQPARYGSAAPGRLGAGDAAVLDRFSAALAADRSWRD
jgi:hypothetical protein